METFNIDKNTILKTSLKRVYTLSIQTEWEDGESTVDSVDILAMDEEEARTIVLNMPKEEGELSSKVVAIGNFVSILRYLMEHDAEDIYNEEDLEKYIVEFDE